MRPTDFCHLNDLRVPVPRVFPAHCATFIAWTPHGVLGSVRLTGGPSVSRHSRTLRRIVAGHALPSCLLARVPFPVRELGAWALSSHGASKPIEPLTPLSPLPLPRGSSERLRDSFVAFALASVIAFPREEAAKVAVTTCP